MAQDTRTSSLASVRATRAVLERFGLQTKHALGQNFLVDDAVVAHIIALSGLSGDDTVLEVGPGIGTLTVALLPRAAHVLAVERDAELLPVLESTGAPWVDKLTLVCRDAVGFSPDEALMSWPVLPNVFIANLPYGVATTLVLDTFSTWPSIQSATVMVQREVGERMQAQPGTKAYGAYTVKLGMRARPVGQFVVKPQSFYPAPKVTSMVIRLDRCPACDATGDPVSADVLHAADMLADAAFAQRRKTIANSLSSSLPSRVAGWSSQQTAALLSAGDIDAGRRGETLSHDEFIRLAGIFAEMLR